MQRRNPARGSAAIPVAIALCLLVLTLATGYYFVAVEWSPPPITEFGLEIDAQFTRTVIITGIVFVLSQLGLGWLVIRYRDRGGRAIYSHGSKSLEVLWTTATAVMFVGLGIYAVGSWGAVHFEKAGPDALVIEVTGQQFAWNFRYPGPDGMFGRLDPAKINDAGGNPVGIDERDPAGQDDVVLPTMAVPVNRQVKLLLRAKDVTHSWYVRELRLKQDTVPGLVIEMHFTATQTGRYEIACAELCGLGHHRMRAALLVLSQQDFEKWLREQAEDD